MDGREWERLSSFATISRELLAEPEEDLTLERIVKLAVEAVPGCDFCGISLRRGQGKVETPASTASVVDESDALQYEFNEGPCLDAIWEGDTYVVQDLRTDPRWPRWAPKAAALGFGSILSVRVVATADTRGGLNLYAARPHAFDADDVDMAHLFASYAASALEASQLVTGLRRALETRLEIGVAQGMLLQRYGLSLPNSFALLRRHSQLRNIKLREVAHQIVAAGPIPDCPDGDD
ncbi:GAF and ANTAR domain-containing protein [Microlunatus panaciterrae]|uniref:GAF domain-containing protein n=1 Tax=Microlunatus panaciterrae TaxID=400768 RepID=A0ABS2RF77_9ACTN|nr:GAF and ANTAR domain-containing protein [Microlunatus panaciterrae]MBM7797646.1 GAF domain-containing protein [Microlunatus panaciterrae]